MAVDSRVVQDFESPLLVHVAAPQPAAQWTHYKLPGKAATAYRFGLNDGRKSVQVDAQSSASMLRYPLHIEPQDLSLIRFSWKVPALILGSDFAERHLDDAPVRMVLAFEGDRNKFSTRNALLSELAQTLTGEPLPYATLMYVWCNKRTPGTVVVNPRTDRIRTLVVESGPKNLNQWVDYERNIRADYERAFGEAPGALVGVALMTDSDNTQSRTQAWYGPVQIGRFGPSGPSGPTGPTGLFDLATPVVQNPAQGAIVLGH